MDGISVLVLFYCSIFPKNRELVKIKGLGVVFLICWFRFFRLIY